MIVVIGASNVDYLGKTFGKYIEADSNPGSLRTSYGGVGRNIVENLSRLGSEVVFITASGYDHLEMIEELKGLGVDVKDNSSDVLPCSSYVAICDSEGKMVSALCDTRIIDNISPEFVSRYSDILEKADYIVPDANLNQETIDFVFDNFRHKKIVVDAISTSKVMKYQKHLRDIHILKCNKIEADRIDCSKDSPEYLVITNGSKNVILRHGDKENAFPVIRKESIVNETGAGDALLSGLLHSIDMGKSIEEGIILGIKASSVTLDVMEAVNKNIREIL